MQYQLVIHFDSAIPTPENLLRKVKEITGLNELSLVKKSYYKFEHQYFRNAEFYFFDENNCYVLFLNNNSTNYLVEVTVAALVHFGGRYEHAIPEWAYKKWDDIKDSFSREKN